VGDLNALDPRFSPWVRALLMHALVPVIVSSTLRVHAEQALLFRKRQLGQNPFPVLPPGRSMHERGLAVDLTAPWTELRRLGRIWRSWGGVWGGLDDPPHFEATRRLLLRQPEIVDD